MEWLDQFGQKRWKIKVQKILLLVQMIHLKTKIKVTAIMLVKIKVMEIPKKKKVLIKLVLIKLREMVLKVLRRNLQRMNQREQRDFKMHC